MVWCLPLLVIAGLLGIPEEDAAPLQACTAATIDQTNAELTFEQLTPQLREFLRYLDDLFEGRARRSTTPRSGSV